MQEQEQEQDQEQEQVQDKKYVEIFVLRLVAQQSTAINREENSPYLTKQEGKQVVLDKMYSIIMSSVM